MTNITIDTNVLGAYEREILEKLSAPKGFGRRLLVHMSEAKRHINVPASTLRDWCKAGKVTAEKRGWAWYLSVDSAREYRDSADSRLSQSQRRRRAREGAERGE